MGTVTNPPPTLEVALVPAAAAADAAFVEQVADLVNVVYADAEAGLWRDGAERVTREQAAGIVRTGELATARLDGELVGAVRLQRLDGGLGEFGMLVASPAHRGVGIGRELVAFAEDWARRQGLPRMQLELLVPQAWTHPVKAFLHGWYTRIGYRHVRTGRLDDDYPGMEAQLATPCEFRIYHKTL